MDDINVLKVVVLTVAAGLGLAMLRLLVKRETDRFVGRMIVLGFFAKLIGSGLRFTVMGDLYGGRGDFNRYFRNGVEIAGVLRSGTLPEQARSTGTPFMDFIVGVAYAVIPNHCGSVSSCSHTFVRWRLPLPTSLPTRGPGREPSLYAALVFFAPTMVFWPSSIGKEAWLVFSLGVAAYGAARVLRRARFGYA
jgi:hypothetical protein